MQVLVQAANFALLNDSAGQWGVVFEVKTFTK